MVVKTQSWIELWNSDWVVYFVYLRYIFFKKNFLFFKLFTYKHAQRKVVRNFLVNSSKLPMKLQNSNKNCCSCRQKKYKQTWQSGGILNWYSQKKNVYQQFTSYTSAVRKSVGDAFSGHLETWISKNFPLLSTLRIPHGDSELSKL